MVQYSGIDHVITERRNINISLTYSLSWKSKCNETNNKSLNNIKKLSEITEKFMSQFSMSLHEINANSILQLKVSIK